MKRILFLVILILTAATICSAQTTFYFPHVANGVLGGTIWKTTIFLTNPAASGTASGTIAFTKDDTANPGAAGSVFSSIAFVDQAGAPAGSGGTITFSIPGGQTRKYTSTGVGDYAGGFATVVATSGSVSGTAIFSEFDLSGRLIAEAGVPSGNAVQNQAIFVDTIGGYNIGVAYAVPGAASANISLSLLNSSAVTVATTTQVLGTGNHGAAFTSQIFVGSPELAGTMQLRSSVPIAAIALRFDPTFTVFTTLPPVSIASLINPVMNWLDQRPWLLPVASIARLLDVFKFRVG